MKRRLNSNSQEYHLVKNLSSKKEQKNSLWTPEELRKEEVRGVFVIGILATIISLRVADFPFLG
jgi:hypothetical protein